MTDMFKNIKKYLRGKTEGTWEGLRSRIDGWELQSIHNKTTAVSAMAGRSSYLYLVIFF